MPLDLSSLAGKDKPVLSPGDDRRALAEYLLALGRWSGGTASAAETSTDADTRS
ncbi:hypothetical protein [Sphingomonas rubra]|uniref:hypothetical protein n=1 Tax=Sphingomonas rubra TaxID=634430 RepID=UPI0015A64AF0|nr:hypothetical protein [Sphingomonas rubra]